MALGAKRRKWRACLGGSANAKMARSRPFILTTLHRSGLLSSCRAARPWKPCLDSPNGSPKPSRRRRLVRFSRGSRPIDRQSRFQIAEYAVSGARRESAHCPSVLLASINFGGPSARADHVDGRIFRKLNGANDIVVSIGVIRLVILQLELKQTSPGIFEYEGATLDLKPLTRIHVAAGSDLDACQSFVVGRRRRALLRRGREGALLATVGRRLLSGEGYWRAARLKRLDFSDLNLPDTGRIRSAAIAARPERDCDRVRCGQAELRLQKAVPCGDKTIQSGKLRRFANREFRRLPGFCAVETRIRLRGDTEQRCRAAQERQQKRRLCHFDPSPEPCRTLASRQHPGWLEIAVGPASEARRYHETGFRDAPSWSKREPADERGAVLCQHPPKAPDENWRQFPGPRRSDGRLLNRPKMVGTTGIEPVTPPMSRECSPAELRAPPGPKPCSQRSRRSAGYSDSWRGAQSRFSGN
jgi:hypothetical protein